MDLAHGLEHERAVGDDNRLVCRLVADGVSQEDRDRFVVLTDDDDLFLFLFHRASEGL